jgi:hypothetical protein
MSTHLICPCGYTSPRPLRLQATCRCGAKYDRNGKLLLAANEAIAPGVGTFLKSSFVSIGIAATHTCKCGKRARRMDREGPGWCEQNMKLIVSWLREEAIARGIPFVEIAAKLLVRRAIAKARRVNKQLPA